MTTPTTSHVASLAEVAMDAHQTGALLTITPHDHDVLCGRGGLTNHHKGNAWYRRLVSCNRPLYRSSPKHTKLLVSKAIVQAVHSQTPPGRFLERHKTTGLWHPVPYKRAVDKTSQALREKERATENGEQGEGVVLEQHARPPLPPVTLSSLGTPNSTNDKGEPHQNLKETTLHDLARAAVERAGGMPNYAAAAVMCVAAGGVAPSAKNATTKLPQQQQQLSSFPSSSNNPALVVQPAPTPPQASTTTTPPLPPPTLNENIKSQMSTYAIQALQSAGGIPKNWGFPAQQQPQPTLPPHLLASASTMTSLLGASSSMSSLGALFPPGSSLGPTTIQAAAAPVVNATSVASAPGSKPPAAPLDNNTSSSSAISHNNNIKIPPPPKRIRQVSSGGGSRISRNHRKLPTKKRRILTEDDHHAAAAPTEPLQDRASSMFRYFQENKIIPTAPAATTTPTTTEHPNNNHKKRKTSGEAASVSSSSNTEDTPLTLLMQVATSELVHRDAEKDETKETTTTHLTNGGHADAADAPPSPMRSVTSQMSDWFRTSFLQQQQIPTTMDPSVASMQPPSPTATTHLTPAVSSTLLKLAPSRLLSGFSALFDRNHQPQHDAVPSTNTESSTQEITMHNNNTAPRKRSSTKSTGSLLDDYEDSDMEAKLRTVPTTTTDYC